MRGVHILLPLQRFINSIIYVSTIFQQTPNHYVYALFA